MIFAIQTVKKRFRHWMRRGWYGLILAGVMGAQAAERGNPALVRSRRETQTVTALARQRQTPEVGEELVYAFFPDVAYTVTVSRVEQVYNAITLITSQVKDGREVTCQSVIAPDGERLTVRDRRRARLYQCVSVATGGWEYLEYDLTKELPRTPLPPLYPPGTVTSSTTAATHPIDMWTTQAEEPALPLTTTVIDVMVVYDTTAQAWVAGNGGMQAFAADAVARMNLAMTTSGIDCTFRLVHTVGKAYTYNTAGDLSAPLYAIQQGTGVFSDLAAIRNAYEADLVTILVDTGSAYGYVGLGWLLNSSYGSPDFAFTACAIRSVNQAHTLTHEVGHNLGCGHAANQPDPGPGSLYTYAAGYYFTAGNTKFHTIMAYNQDKNGVFYDDTDYFSTPLKTYKTSGVVVGNASTADNAQVIRNTMTAISNYRTMAVPGKPTNIVATDGTSTMETLVSWTSVLRADSYTIWRGTSSSWWLASQIGTSTGPTYSDQTGTPGALYYYWVKAVNEGGASSFSSSGDSGYRALEAPAGLSASGGIQTGGVAVNWDSVTGATYYRVYRATSAAGGKTTLGTSWQPGRTYNDTSATAGMPYYYFAQAAVNASGLRPSAYSAYDLGFWVAAAPIIDNGLVTNGIVGNVFQMDFEGLAGITYHILHKDELADVAWTTNTTVTPVANGPQSVQIELTPGQAQGFYRLEMAP